MKTALEPSDVRDIYLCLLGREPENDHVVHQHLHMHAGLAEMLNSVLQSSEFQARFQRKSDTIHPFSHSPQGSKFHIMHNYFSEIPDLSDELKIECSPVALEDVDLVKRIRRAFLLADEQQSLLPSELKSEGVWRIVGRTHHNKLATLLKSCDFWELAVYLANGLRQEIAYGLLSIGHLQSFSVPGVVRRSRNEALAFQLLIKDKLVRLAVALGVLPVENPEQGRYGMNIHIPLQTVVERIERHVGVEIHRPFVMGITGIDNNGRVYDAKTADDAYLAYLIKKLWLHEQVAEIGGGFGGAAYQLTRYNVFCSIFDLPIVGVIQAFFLAKVLGPEKIALYGESPQSDSIKIRPWWRFFDDTDHFSVVFNRDSMAEFRRTIASKYLIEIKRRRIPFFSINQEVEYESGDEGINQLNVGGLATEVGLQRRSRYPYWLRRGYVEELFLQ